MPIINFVLAMDASRGLGKNNQLLCHLPADLQHFKQLTLGKPIVMGRKTFESIGRPLPGRPNIVLSQAETMIPDVTICHTVDEVLMHTASSPEIMIIGGAQIYHLFLPLVDTIYLTLIHHQFEADVFFPPIDSDAFICKKISFRPKDEKNLYDLTFYEYKRKVF